MTFINKALIIFALLITPFSYSQAQELEYKMELGGMLGGSFYMGDANYTTPFKNTNFAGALIARYVFNPHMVIKANLAMGKISGNTADFKNVYPGGLQTSFKRNIFDLGAQYEYNFWGYGTGNGYNGNKKITPYILGGFGFTFAPSEAKNVFTFPIGLGVKYKVAPRVNIGCEFTMRFSLSDELDVTNKEGLQLNNPYGIKGKGFKNKDSYAFMTLFVTYDLFPKYRKCNNL